VVIRNDQDDEGETAMGMLRIISKRGDDRLFWNEKKAIAGDAEAMAAIREAERIFAQERDRGATAFRVDPGQPIERLEQFDSQATQIVMVPRVVGG
jgi:regulator of protease activity HflC (stomatin/prohibitin superfamily)